MFHSPPYPLVPSTGESRILDTQIWNADARSVHGANLVEIISPRRHHRLQQCRFTGPPRTPSQIQRGPIYQFPFVLYGTLTYNPHGTTSSGTMSLDHRRQCHTNLSVNRSVQIVIAGPPRKKIASRPTQSTQSQDALHGTPAPVSRPTKPAQPISA